MVECLSGRRAPPVDPMVKVACDAGKEELQQGCGVLLAVCLNEMLAHRRSRAGEQAVKACLSRVFQISRPAVGGVLLMDHAFACAKKMGDGGFGPPGPEEMRIPPCSTKRSKRAQVFSSMT